MTVVTPWELHVRLGVLTDLSLTEGSVQELVRLMESGMEQSLIVLV